MSYDISDKRNQKYCELTSALKLIKLLLNDHLIRTAIKGMNKKLQIKNAVLFYQLVSKFKLSSLNTTVFRYIARCFSMIVETESFLELDVNSVSKLLASSGLQIDSEVEVYNAANKWLNHNIKERSKFARKLLLKVRLNLLSDHCLKYLINESSLISNNNDCLEVLKNRDRFIMNVSTIHNESRQCNQNMFKILICGGYNKIEKKFVTQVKEINVNNFKEYKDFTSMVEERHRFKAVYLKGEVFVFGGFNEVGPTKSVEKYSPLSKKCVKVTDIPNKRQDFCACAFIDNIYLFGGYDDGPGYLKSCLRFDAKLFKWNEVAKMNQARSRAACAIYEGNIVVSGGTSDGFIDLSTVKSYDVFGSVWTPMPSMIEERSNHSLVCFKRKMFAIGGADYNTNCEVFDKISNKFVILEAPNFFSYNVESALVGSKILVFQNYTEVLLCYDVDKDEWSKELCKATENIYYYSVVKMPSY